MRILVAGMGNVLRSDDGFGVRAAEAYAANPARPANVTVLEAGIGGLHVVQELMQRYDAVILFDACDRRAAPGTLFVLEPLLPDMAGFSETEKRDYFCETHYATPMRALALAREVGALPPLVRIVGCQIADADVFEPTMHPAVAAAIGPAVALCEEIVARLQRERAEAGPGT